MFADEQIKAVEAAAAEFEQATPVQQRRVLGLLECAVRAMESIKNESKA